MKGKFCTSSSPPVLSCPRCRQERQVECGFSAACHQDTLNAATVVKQSHPEFASLRRRHNGGTAGAARMTHQEWQKEMNEAGIKWEEVEEVEEVEVVEEEVEEL